MRFKDPGTDWNAQVLGGGYAWNAATNTCQDAVTYFLATVADGPGHCGQIAGSAYNPGYNTDAPSAAPLKKVLGSKGNC